ncbi:Rne/Rng family ribonuclease [Sediminibacillus dalangtanensis]|uniref:Rne/Rng family ribonuclease n=1 Tax=Sediminibacillus dalangtanensis TaxID=2729421 RepID=A0ABX7VSN4_9BACI|nr:Rne/Rng family ribonuclease [Sediminibacillus dalangtanensis]QTM99951.1 Rne/Rng family ribonuclease [Sediminibacillus dalangtanensis]
MLTIYIQAQATEKVGIIEENGEIKEFVVDRPGWEDQVGNIYQAQVSKIEKGLQAAFVDFGSSRPGFLLKKELPEGKKNPERKLENMLTQGQRLFVQVQKAAYGEKGAKLTANLTLPGISIIYMPFGGYVAVSKKIAEPQRSEWREKLGTILNQEEGVIIRTSAAQTDFALVAEELNRLRRQWKEISGKAVSVKTPSCIFEDQLIPDRLLRSFAPEKMDKVVIDSANLVRSVRQAFPALAEKTEWKKDLIKELPYSVNQLFENAIRSRVKLPKGVELYIDQTEALTVIDVNSASFTGRNSKQHTAVKTNRIAAEEIARQLRLRNIAGIIIVDFINMDKEEDRSELIRHFRQHLTDDPIRTEIYGFTKLGLLEMTRKRESYSLSYLLQDNSNSGLGLSASTRVYMLERDLYDASYSGADAVVVVASYEFIKLFSQLLSLPELSAKLGNSLYMVTDNSLRAGYQIGFAGSQKQAEVYLGGKATESVDKLF